MPSCSKRFTTYERTEEQPLRRQKEGTRQPSTAANPRPPESLREAPHPAAKLEEIVNRIELDLYGQFDREVGSKIIGEMVMKELRELDQVAYVRFASVYREFKDAADFVDALQPFDQKEGELP